MTVNYDEQTQEAILSRMIENSPETIDTREGSITRDLLSPASIELAYLYVELMNVLDFGFADTTYGVYLDRRCNEVGITRKSSVPAVGEVTFTGEGGTSIPNGTRVATADTEPIYFQTIQDAAIGEDGQVTTQVKAEQGGLNGNVSVGRISQVIGNLASVLTVTNAAPFDGGADEESDEDLFTRYQIRMKTPATSGNKFQYEQWAMGVDGVGAVKVYPLHRGNGTVDVVLLDTEMTTTDPSVTENVRVYLESVRPIGADVLIRGATEVPINLSLTLTLEQKKTAEEAKADITKHITEYLKNLAFTDSIVRYNQIGTLILNSASVLDYSGLTLNGGTDNIEIPDGDVAVLGEVTIL